MGKGSYIGGHSIWRDERHWQKIAYRKRKTSRALKQRQEAKAQFEQALAQFNAEPASRLIKQAKEGQR